MKYSFCLVLNCRDKIRKLPIVSNSLNWMEVYCKEVSKSIYFLVFCKYETLKEMNLLQESNLDVIGDVCCNNKSKYQNHTIDIRSSDEINTDKSSGNNARHPKDELSPAFDIPTNVVVSTPLTGIMDTNQMKRLDNNTSDHKMEKPGTERNLLHSQILENDNEGSGCAFCIMCIIITLIIFFLGILLMFIVLLNI